MSEAITLKDALAVVDNDVDLLQTLIELYFKQLPSLMDAIQTGLAAHNGELVERNAHSLRGAISVFGRHAAREAAHDLENLGRDGNWPAGTVAAEQLQRSLADLALELRSLQHRLAAGELAGTKS